MHPTRSLGVALGKGSAGGAFVFFATLLFDLLLPYWLDTYSAFPWFLFYRTVTIMWLVGGFRDHLLDAEFACLMLANSLGDGLVCSVFGVVGFGICCFFYVFPIFYNCKNNILQLGKQSALDNLLLYPFPSTW